MAVLAVLAGRVDRQPCASVSSEAQPRMWDPAPVCYLDTPQLRLWFAYLAYHPPTGTHPADTPVTARPAAAHPIIARCATTLHPAGGYPLDAHLLRLGPHDHVFLLLTWVRLGFGSERWRFYAGLSCKARAGCPSLAAHHTYSGTCSSRVQWDLFITRVVMQCTGCHAGHHLCQLTRGA